MRRLERRGEQGAAWADARRRAEALRYAFERATRLRAATRLIGGRLLMPGPRGTRTTVTLTVGGLQFDRLESTTTDARRVFDRKRALTTPARETASRLLPREAADCLLIAERHLRRDGGVYRFIPREPGSEKEVGSHS